MGEDDVELIKDKFVESLDKFRSYVGSLDLTCEEKRTIYCAVREGKFLIGRVSLTQEEMDKVNKLAQHATSMHDMASGFARKVPVDRERDYYPSREIRELWVSKLTLD